MKCVGVFWCAFSNIIMLLVDIFPKPYNMNQDSINIHNVLKIHNKSNILKLYKSKIII